ALGYLCLPRVWIVLQGLPLILCDLGDRVAYALVLLDPDRELDPPIVKLLEGLLVLKTRVASHQDRPGRSGAAHPCEQLIDEPWVTALGVRRAFAVTDVQHLAPPRACREQRVIPKLFRVPITGALLLITAHLTNEGVDVDHQTLLAGTRTSPPRARERLGEQPIELAHMPEGERPQE